MLLFKNIPKIIAFKLFSDSFSFVFEFPIFVDPLNVLNAFVPSTLVYPFRFNLLVHSRVMKHFSKLLLFESLVFWH